MGENNDSFFDKIWLENIDEEIPTDVNLMDTPANNSPSTTITSTVSKLKNYIDDDIKYDETAES